VIGNAGRARSRRSGWRQALLLAILLLCSARPLGAQVVVPVWALDPRLAAPAASAGDLPRVTVDRAAVAGRRPWWAFPAAGAITGGVLGGVVAYRLCRVEDCVGAEVFPVTTAVAGVAVGLLVEGAVRALR
jgi:hypothetical protein